MWEDKLSFTQSKFGIWLLGVDLSAKTGVTTVRLVRLQWHAAMLATFLKLNCSRASDGSKRFRIRQNSAAREDFPGFLSHESPFLWLSAPPGFPLLLSGLTHRVHVWSRWLPFHPFINFIMMFSVSHCKLSQIFLISFANIC